MTILRQLLQFPWLLSWALVASLAAGCSEGAKFTYLNPQFDYSVEMPSGWEIVENPVSLITGGEYSETTVGFRSEPSIEADWLYVEVEEGKSALMAVSDQRLGPGSAEYKVSEYGKNNYLVRSRFSYAGSPSWTEWRSTYYIEHNKRLYITTFKNPHTEKNVFVTIEGYGKVNH